MLVTPRLPGGTGFTGFELINGYVASISNNEVAFCNNSLLWFSR